MTLEERLTALAKKGELTHLSLAFYNDQFHAKLAAASGNGYASAEHQDPVQALELVFAASPVKVRRSPAREPEREEITATVTEPLPATEEAAQTALPQDWTAP